MEGLNKYMKLCPTRDLGDVRCGGTSHHPHPPSKYGFKLYKTFPQPTEGDNLHTFDQAGQQPKKHQETPHFKWDHTKEKNSQ